MLEIIRKFAKLFLVPSNNEVTKVMHVDNEGSVFMTDSFKAIDIKHAVEAADIPHTLDASGKVSTIPFYKSKAKFFDSSNCVASTVLTVDEIYRMVQAFQAISALDDSEQKQLGNFRLTVSENEVIATYRGVNVQSKYFLGQCEGENTEVTLTAGYVADVLKALKDLQYQEFKLLLHKSSLRPIHLETNDGNVRAVVLPVRVYGER